MHPIYSTPLTFTEEGQNQIYAVAFDNNDNNSDAAFKDINIDKSVPEINIAIPNTDVAVGSKMRINYSVVDNISGVQSVEVSLNGILIASNNELLIDKPGENIIKVTAEDNAGNIALKTIVFTAYIPASITMFPSQVNITRKITKK